MRGIHPILNSLLQTPGEPNAPSLWPSFHSSHTAHLADALNRLIRPRYAAFAEQSLQVHDLLDDIEGDLPAYRAVAIREALPQARIGRVVTWVELLSPANKSGGRHHASYRLKRQQVGEVALVEIDYLHESPPILPGLPVYPHDPGSLPYMVAISEPRKGVARVYGWGVDQALPAVPIPLAGEEFALLDLEAVYRHSFSAGPWEMVIGADALPLRMDTYSAADQARIRAVFSSGVDG